jgi:hypothetical protein
VPPDQAVIASAVHPPNPEGALALMNDGNEVHRKHRSRGSIPEALVEGGLVRGGSTRQKAAGVPNAARQQITPAHFRKGLVLEGEQAGDVGVLESAYTVACGSAYTLQDAC